MEYGRAREIAEELLRSASPGEEVTFQDEGEMGVSHRHSGQTSGESHVDGWHATKNADGSLTVKKFHSDL